MVEGEGFEPSIELQTLYSLSRGAPSATRTPLRRIIQRVINRKKPINTNKWWRDRDLNPRGAINPCRFSRPVHSTTLPSLHVVMQDNT